MAEKDIEALGRLKVASLQYNPHKTRKPREGIYRFTTPAILSAVEWKLMPNYF
jgi:hypothetical protein